MKIVNHEALIIDAPVDPIYTVARAARTCYKSEDKHGSKADMRLVKAIINRGHEAMLEFVDVTFRLQTDRGISHELVRHRIASYAQESTRYCNYGDKDIEFIKPVDLNPGAYNIWHNLMEDCENSYKNMLTIGHPPQVARSVLPNSLKTEVVCKFNLRSLRNFFGLRLAKDAHPDMRYLAKQMMLTLLKHKGYQVFFDDILEDYIKDGKWVF